MPLPARCLINRECSCVPDCAFHWNTGEPSVFVNAHERAIAKNDLKRDRREVTESGGEIRPSNGKWSATGYKFGGANKL